MAALAGCVGGVDDCPMMPTMLASVRILPDSPQSGKAKRASIHTLQLTRIGRPFLFGSLNQSFSKG